MDTFNCISLLENNLKAFVTLQPTENEIDSWNLIVQLFYDGEPTGGARFTLHGYNRAEAEHVARNIKDNAYLMREIDEYLWGESD